MFMEKVKKAVKKVSSKVKGMTAGEMKAFQQKGFSPKEGWKGADKK